MDVAMNLEMFYSKALEILYSSLSNINMSTNPPGLFCVCFNQPADYTGETEQREYIQIFCLLSLMRFISWCPDAGIGH